MSLRQAEKAEQLANSFKATSKEQIDKAMTRSSAKERDSKANLPREPKTLDQRLSSQDPEALFTRGLSNKMASLEQRRRIRCRLHPLPL